MTDVVTTIPEDKLSNLLGWNKFMGVLHLLQSVVIAILGLAVTNFSDFEQRLYIFNLEAVFEDGMAGEGPPSAILPVAEELFAFRGVAPVLLSLFLFASAVAHLLIAFPLSKRYGENLAKGMNPYRWYEYAFSSSLMIVFIMLSFGILGFWLVVSLFVLNALMNIFGLYMEELNHYKTGKTDWKPYLWGWVAGIVPWIVIADNIRRFDIPEGFEALYLIFYIALGIYFFFFNTFAINMFLQYAKIWKWSDYLFGEKVYQVLSLVAKSILCWLVFIAIFANT